ncbi:hypothetical protein ACJMK2_002444, partial [Sinanodonta woodiana]
MEKVFKLAVVSEVNKVEWRESRENSFQKGDVSVYSLHLCQTCRYIEGYSTLLEKEKHLILNYKERALLF